MGVTWALHGRYMGITWALHGHYMGVNTWAFAGALNIDIQDGPMFTLIIIVSDPPMSEQTISQKNMKLEYKGTKLKTFKIQHET